MRCFHENYRTLRLFLPVPLAVNGRNLAAQAGRMYLKLGLKALQWEVLLPLEPILQNVRTRLDHQQLNL